MKVQLQYGTKWIGVNIPATDVMVLEPKFVEGMPDEDAAFRAAVRHPIGSCPMTIPYLKPRN